MYRRILLTGGTGYLGSLLLRVLVQTHYVVLLKRKHSDLKRIINLQRNIDCYNVEEINISSIIEKHQIDTVIHVATSYGRGDVPKEAVDAANIELPLAIIEASKFSGVKYFINTDTSLPENVNYYATSKKYFWNKLKEEKHFKGIINMIPEYFYGVGDDHWKLITMIIRKLKNQDENIEFTSGKQERDFIHVSDVVNAYVVVLNNLDNLRGINEFSLCTGNRISIKSLATLCKELSNNRTTKLLFGVLPDRENEFNQLVSNNESLLALGWLPKVSLKDGIVDMINNEVYV